MQNNHLWNEAKSADIQTGPEIVGNFDVGFDAKIPEETKDALMRFVYWVEDNFSLPVTLWVDFKYNHYLLDESGKLHLEKADLCAYAHGDYYALGKILGHFGFSAAKKKKKRK